jgi:hypothetical protein
MILGFITEWRKRRKQRCGQGGRRLCKRASFAAAATLAITLGLSAAHAYGLPGMRRHDHTGITVPDMNEALTFFVDVLDARRRCPLDRSPIRSRTAPS